MEIHWLIIAMVASVLIGAAITWLLCRIRITTLNEQGIATQQELSNTRTDLDQKNETIFQLNRVVVRLETTLEHERKASHEKLGILNDATMKLGDAFKALSSEALRSNNQSFLELAKITLEKYQTEAKGDLEQRQKAVEHLVIPIRQSLDKVDTQIQELEKARQQAYGGLTEQIKSLIYTQEKLQSETGNLVSALRTPAVRGTWGEIQLKRVVEIAGMLEYCDFYQQQTATTEDGRLRPDMLVRLPGGKNIVIDAKTPLQSYLDASETANEELRLSKLQVHAQQIRTHMAKLSAKSYWEQFQPTPEFVVLFLPGEIFFSAALELDPALIEEGAKQQVILATPTTLIALLRAVYHGWRQEQMSENTRKISDLGRELHERIATMVEHLTKLGGSLGKAVEAFNAAVASFEGRVLPAVRKFQTLGAGSKKEIEELTQLDKGTRMLMEIQDGHDTTLPPS
ncbi:MAG: recombinase RmuC [Candidatus Brocadia carolinensis]|uniref:Recombinase RmuC n=1 Tax=Candidatus Brocadia carolinensis TaxID=1004156 RepID=A0A1V4AXX8_9BACT|nr:MAG: recombinase RmuC [Candidatus Brocadia caroliniensis]